MNSRCLFKTTTLGQRRWPPRRATVRRAAALRRRRGTAALAVSALFGIWQIGLFGGKGKFVSSVSLAGKNMPVRTLEFIGKVQLESLQFQNLVLNTTLTFKVLIHMKLLHSF